jgi:hypothetical protein
MNSRKIDTLALVTVALSIVTLAGVLTGCTRDQAQRPEKPSTGTAVASQPAPWVDPACYVEGHLVAVECNELGAWPWCPAEDSPRHAGVPCFWINPNGKGLLWSDGVQAADER